MLAAIKKFGDGNDLPLQRDGVRRDFFPRSRRSSPQQSAPGRWRTVWPMSTTDPGDFLDEHLYNELRYLLCAATEWLVQKAIPDPPLGGDYVQIYVMDWQRYTPAHCSSS